MGFMQLQLWTEAWLDCYTGQLLMVCALNVQLIC